MPARKVPHELIEEILARHAKGQSDPSIATWLASLDPPIIVGSDAVRKIRKQSGQPTLTGAKAETLNPNKASGAAGRKAKAARDSQEAADHGKRGAVVLEVAEEADPLRAHVYQLQVCLELQRKVAADTVMTLPDKIRFSTLLGQTIAKLRTDAEIEKTHDEIRKAWAVRLAELDARETEIKREEKRLRELRRDLEAKQALVHAN